MHLKFSRWFHILLDFELSKVVPFIKSRKTRWGHYVWVNKEELYNCIAFVIYVLSPYKCMRVGWNNRLTTLQEGVLGEWNGSVLLTHQLDNRTVWRVGWMKAVIIIRLTLWYHPFTIYTWILALLVEKILRLLLLVPRHLLNMLNKPNFKYSLYMYRKFMKHRIWKSHWAEKEYSCTYLLVPRNPSIVKKFVLYIPLSKDQFMWNGMPNSTQFVLHISLYTVHGIFVCQLLCIYSELKMLINWLRH